MTMEILIVGVILFIFNGVLGLILVTNYVINMEKLYNGKLSNKKCTNCTCKIKIDTEKMKDALK